MSAAQKHVDSTIGKAAELKDIRVEMKIKNNVLWHAIFDRYESVPALCRAHPELATRYSRIYELLRFKISPFKRKWDPEQKKRYVTSQYRRVCLLLEQILKVPVEDLFPAHLYEAAVGSATERVFEVSSFTALPSAARHELRLLPAIRDKAPEIEMDRQLLRERLTKVFEALTDREREVVKLRYGLEGGREHTLEEISKIFGCSRQNIRRIEGWAIRKLQIPSRAMELAGFLD